jgi:hypothetical protein
LHVPIIAAFSVPVITDGERANAAGGSITIAVLLGIMAARFIG